MYKKALEVRDASPYAPLRALGATVGRLGALPETVLGSSPMSWGENLSTGTREQALPIAGDLENRYPEELKDTVVRMGGPDTWDDLKRVWSNDRTYMPQKVMGTVSTPISNLLSALHRNDNYNPYSDTATVYSGIPEAVAHELGQAVDFNKRDNFERGVYSLGRGIENKLVPIGAGPLTLYQEHQANHNALEALTSDRAKARYWANAAPAFGTVAAGGVLAGLKAHDSIVGGDSPYQHLQRGMNYMVSGAPKITQGPLKALIPFTAGSLGGHLVAGVRNALADEPSDGVKVSIAVPLRHPRPTQARYWREYRRHSALNAGQALRDLRYLTDHPDASKHTNALRHAVESMKLRLPSLGTNIKYTLIPPQTHHTPADLSYLDAAGTKGWFLHGYKPWKYKDPLLK